MEPIPKSGLFYPNKIARIYLQALRLKLKGVRHYPHPERAG